MDFSKVESAKNVHKKVCREFIEYGTAGFRTRADLLDHVLFRMGLLAVLRSKLKKAHIGIMITASHNPECDNGVKLVDPHGEMLETSWERIATRLGNAEDEDLISVLESIINEQNIDMENAGKVVTGRDTRASSFGLFKAAEAGVMALNGKVCDFDLISTPLLHFLVVCLNTEGKYGNASTEGYFQKLGNAFNKIRGERKNNGNYVAELQVDGANGIGAIIIMLFQNYLKRNLTIHVCNDCKTGQLNHMCGADYVKIQQKPPNNVPLRANVRCASIDGDGDRIVYYYTDEQDNFHLLDGDRIATLIAAYFQDLLRQSGLNLTLGLVQSAYANGASTEYITKVLKVPVACVPTGVKYLHAKALEFDIGIYFEANGHGTVVFSSRATEMVEKAAKNESFQKPETQAATQLIATMDMINQTVGDALSDMLLVETILCEKGWDIKDWERTYDDLPNKQLKVDVKDKGVITTTDAERKCVTPEGLQAKIEELASKYPKGRSFVRPSGTEDMVRVYAEAENVSDVEKLATEVALAVRTFTGSIPS